MQNRSRYLNRLGIQSTNPYVSAQIQQEEAERQSKIIQQQQQLLILQQQQQQLQSSSSTPSQRSSQIQQTSDSDEPVLATASLSKKLQGFNDEIAKFFDGPVVLLDEKEESTAEGEDDEDEDEENVGQLNSETNQAAGGDTMKPTRSASISRKSQLASHSRRLQLQQSFINKDGDFTINYYIKEDSIKIRNKYINKLISNNILRQEPSKKHQTMIIFDWDDTLFCTSQLHAQRFENITMEQQKSLINLDKSSSTCLKEASNYGETYIITNAAQGWVEYSSKTFLPTVHRYLTELKIKVISARSLYEAKYPSQCHQWKVQAFKDIKTHFDSQVCGIQTLHYLIVLMGGSGGCEIVTNLICLGDSHIEMEAAHELAKEFDKSFIKTVKFKEQPRIEELIKQHDLVKDKFEQIYTNFKNLTIRLEKKQSPKDGMNGR